jgi:hypothetical protein
MRRTHPEIVSTAVIINDCQGHVCVISREAMPVASVTFRRNAGLQREPADVNAVLLRISIPDQHP